MSSVRSMLRPAREVRSLARTYQQSSISRIQARYASNEQKSSEDPPLSGGPNQNQLPHVSEEQAAIDKITGQTPPDIEQGTPVQEILKRDQQMKDSAPQVIKEQFSGQQKRSYSTSTRRSGLRPTQARFSPAIEDGGLAQSNFQTDSQHASQTLTAGPRPTESRPALISENGMIAGVSYPDAGPGHKFGLPAMESVSRLDHLRRRYDPVVDQVTKSLMRHGKLSQAQKVMGAILDTLRTAPPPQLNPQFPQRTLSLSDGPPAMAAASLGPPNTLTPATSQDSNSAVYLPRAVLPLHPIAYLTTIIDSVAPLVKIRQLRGIAGGGATLPVPVPLSVRQRRRQAIQWIMGAADNRRETRLADRVARELLNVAEGKSGVWDKRALVHRSAVSSRSNVKVGKMSSKRR